MSEKIITTGGGAFPGATGGDGMDLRDWFAGQALVGLLLWSNDRGCGNLLQSDEPGPFSHPLFARAAYRFADAMLAERAK